MKKQLIILSAIIAITGTSGLVVALKDDKPISNNKLNQESSMPEEPQAQEPTNPVQSVEAQPTTPVTTPVQTELPLNDTSATAPVIDVKQYAKDKFTEYAEKGIQGMTYNCFDTLMQKQFQWDVSTGIIDNAIDRISSNYQGTCAALANYNEHGTY